MKEWIPIPGSSKEILIKVALEEFSSKSYEEVNITELATKANMTTGAVYHHFGSKAKLYEVIRNEMEQRIIDRMEGATSLFEDSDKALEAALITGIDFAVKFNICRLISEEVPYNKTDKIEQFLAKINTNKTLPLETILISSWRSILKVISNGHISIEQGKNLIKWIFKRELK
ncbi:TetR/AcrR family transcriptional regulator [Neobacillus sp. PS2-9]|uniref:TetR/AcrR family transcriptional regulator n=1 Tax=Neobacillus sp. PS2-9 TaxID=3070676 RepID=UPI0027E0AFBA|nr:TetR/AcrR family transcriptional regulator [Neobacillus sp. PS2-9]WML56493.1 TetR/AcrR family transcriptional regulator [Neobacillus sp. PS2-9]